MDLTAGQDELRDKSLVYAGNRNTVSLLSSSQLSHYTDCNIHDPLFKNNS
jgi:hypothetical protein